MRQFNFFPLQAPSHVRPTRSRPLKAYPKRSWHRTFRYLYYRLLRIQGSPESIARGLAVGVFAGWFPWFGLQTLIAIALAILVRGNKVVAAAATWISNPLTYVPIFAFNYQVGRWVLGTNDEPFEVAALSNLDGVKELGGDILVTLFFGSLLIGLTSASMSYVFARRLIVRARRQRRYSRHIKRRWMR
ncbi:DUF2062 domain-containing protein [filamentous cyanobacterium CCP1]|nr:DUF2062 domain-containing protein [filamentous cyanobacterium CCP2]PSB55426.1 DUF2062 domain-containing protein [filamentous cyanobacterium CCP1]